MSNLHTLLSKCLKEDPSSKEMLEIILNNPQLLKTEILTTLLKQPVLLNEKVIQVLFRKPSLLDDMEDHAKYMVEKHNVQICDEDCGDEYCDDAISGDTEFEFDSKIKEFFQELGNELYSKKRNDSEDGKNGSESSDEN